MGVLEDAIRDHLELKRRHGASDDELLREESDALGPARRDEIQVESAEPQAAEEEAAAVAEAELAHEEPAPEPVESAEAIEPAQPAEPAVEPSPERPPWE